jgi:hypothetical protein
MGNSVERFFPVGSTLPVAVRDNMSLWLELDKITGAIRDGWAGRLPCKLLHRRRDTQQQQQPHSSLLISTHQYYCCILQKDVPHQKMFPTSPIAYAILLTEYNARPFHPLGCQHRLHSLVHPSVARHGSNSNACIGAQIHSTNLDATGG